MTETLQPGPEDTTTLLCLATYEQLCGEIMRRQPVALLLALAIPSDKIAARAAGRLDSYVMTGGGLYEMDMLCAQLCDSIDRKLREMGR